MPHKNQKRADYVPAAPVARAIQEWLTEHQMGETSGQAKNPGRYHSPYRILAERVGLTEDAVWRRATGRRYRSMAFDIADRYLCATNRFNLWWDDPELSEVYEQAARGADQVFPLDVTPEEAAA